MTSISTLSTASTSSAYRLPPRPRTGGQDPMAAVAEKLGLSSDDLKTQLKDGKSLDDIATAQGISHEDLITAIKAGMPSDGMSSVTGVEATAMAEKIASTKGMPPPRPGGGHGGPGGPKRANTGVTDSDKLGRLSELLEMDQDEVTGQATTATDLVKLLQNKGVGLNALSAVLHNGDLIDVAA